MHFSLNLSDKESESLAPDRSSILFREFPIPCFVYGLYPDHVDGLPCHDPRVHNSCLAVHIYGVPFFTLEKIA